MDERLAKATERALGGGPERYHDKLKTQGTLFVRDRIDLLVDPFQLLARLLALVFPLRCAALEARRRVELAGGRSKRACPDL